MVPVNPMNKAARARATCSTTRARGAGDCLESLYADVASESLPPAHKVITVITTSRARLPRRRTAGRARGRAKRRPEAPSTCSSSRAARRRAPRRRRSPPRRRVPHLHVRHDRSAEGRDEHPRATSSSTPQALPRLDRLTTDDVIARRWRRCSTSPGSIAHIATLPAHAARRWCSCYRFDAAALLDLIEQLRGTFMVGADHGLHRAA